MHLKLMFFLLGHRLVLMLKRRSNWIYTSLTEPELFKVRPKHKPKLNFNPVISSLTCTWSVEMSPHLYLRYVHRWLRLIPVT